jgi:hypothetical protein
MAYSLQADGGGQRRGSAVVLVGTPGLSPRTRMHLHLPIWEARILTFRARNAFLLQQKHHMLQPRVPGLEPWVAGSWLARPWVMEPGPPCGSSYYPGLGSGRAGRTRWSWAGAST